MFYNEILNGENHATFQHKNDARGFSLLYICSAVCLLTIAAFLCVIIHLERRAKSLAVRNQRLTVFCHEILLFGLIY